MAEFSTKEFGDKLEIIWKDSRFKENENFKEFFERGYSLKLLFTQIHSYLLV